ncbi:hypothetical protein ACLKA6_017815 [Drosophila palustris]
MFGHSLVLYSSTNSNRILKSGEIFKERLRRMRRAQRKMTPCYLRVRRSEYKCLAYQEIKPDPCIPEPCPLPLDVKAYQPSDKRKRKYQKTWSEFKLMPRQKPKVRKIYPVHERRDPKTFRVHAPRPPPLSAHNDALAVLQTPLAQMPDEPQRREMPAGQSPLLLCEARHAVSQLLRVQEIPVTAAHHRLRLLSLCPPGSSKFKDSAEVLSCAFPGGVPKRDLHAAEMFIVNCCRHRAPVLLSSLCPLPASLFVWAHKCQQHKALTFTLKVTLGASRERSKEKTSKAGKE